MTFTEQWFPKVSCDVLSDLAWSVRSLTGDIVEVGSWQGASTCVLARAVEPETVHAVDTWQGSPGEISGYLATKRDVYREFLENVDGLTAGNVEPHRMGWREFFAGYENRVKFCFIDAEHTYSEVKDNIETVLPLLVRGAVLCGDDVTHPPVRQAVLDVLGGDVNAEATLWHWRAP